MTKKRQINKEITNFNLNLKLNIRNNKKSKEYYYLYKQSSKLAIISILFNFLKRLFAKKNIYI